METLAFSPTSQKIDTIFDFFLIKKISWTISHYVDPSVRRSIDPSVRRSVGPPFTFFDVFDIQAERTCITAPAQHVFIAPSNNQIKK